MTTTIDFNGTQIRLTSQFMRIDHPSWSKNYPKAHHRITILTDSARHRFDFWHSSEKGNVMTELELIEAFDMFLGDGISYDNARDIDDFAAEFGYDKVSECIKAYNGCKKEWEAWQKFCINPYDLSNWLRETYDI